MSHNSLEIPDIERRASVRAARSRELRDEEAKAGEIYRPDIEKKQTEFLDLFSACPNMSVKQLCSHIHVRETTYHKWYKESEDFRKALTINYNRTLQVTGMSRKRVMQGILEAIDLAKDQRQANSMITGWKEIGRMCGFYEPERREITISANSAEIIEELTTLSRDKLLELASQQDVIEAEYVELESSPDKPGMETNYEELESSSSTKELSNDGI